jgi:heme-degrading monooxygenase HmoA
MEGIVLRRWCSRIRTADRIEYVRYVHATGLAGYLATPGNLGCQMLLRDLGGGETEVTTLSWWRSMASIEEFAGAEVARAQYYPEDDRFLLAKPDLVEHHEVAVEAPGPTGALLEGAARAVAPK